MWVQIKKTEKGNEEFLCTRKNLAYISGKAVKSLELKRECDYRVKTYYDSKRHILKLEFIEKKDDDSKKDVVSFRWYPTKKKVTPTLLMSSLFKSLGFEDRCNSRLPNTTEKLKLYINFEEDEIK